MKKNKTKHEMKCEKTCADTEGAERQCRIVWIMQHPHLEHSLFPDQTRSWCQEKSGWWWRQSDLIPACFGRPSQHTTHFVNRNLPLFVAINNEAGQEFSETWNIQLPNSSRVISATFATALSLPIRQAGPVVQRMDHGHKMQSLGRQTNKQIDKKSKS